jgi:Uma2 family endonuclease
MNIPLASLPAKIKLSVDQFDLLAMGGGLAGLGRSELIDGDIYLMAPQYRRHAYVKARFHEALLDWTRANRPDLTVFTEASVAMPPNDEPMPDLILTDAPRGPKAIPVDSVALLIEIAESSDDYDLGYKAALYSQQGVPEYWVVDLRERRVVRHHGATPDGYADIVPVAFGTPVVAATLPTLQVATDDLD